LLAKAAGLSDFSATVVQLRPAQLPVPYHVDLVDTGRVKQEAALPPDTMSDPANGEGLLGTAAPAADDDAFEDLDPLPCALDHLGVHLDGVARDQGRNVLALGLSFQQVDDVGHGVQGYHPDSRLPCWSSKSGRRRRVRSAAWARRQRSISAWWPERNTSGTAC